MTTKPREQSPDIQTAQRSAISADELKIGGIGTVLGAVGTGFGLAIQELKGEPLILIAVICLLLGLVSFFGALIFKPSGIILWLAIGFAVLFGAGAIGASVLFSQNVKISVEATGIDTRKNPNVGLPNFDGHRLKWGEPTPLTLTKGGVRELDLSSLARYYDIQLDCASSEYYHSKHADECLGGASPMGSGK